MASSSVGPDRRLAEIGWLVERRRLEQARALLGEALREQPDDVDHLYLAAYVDYLEDAYAPALETLDRVLVLDPHHAGARELRFDCFDETGRLADAEETIIGLLRDYPQDGELYARYALLMLKTLHLDKAQRLAAEGIRYAPQSQLTLLASALCAAVVSPGEETHGRLQALVREHPEGIATMLALVSVLHESGRNAEALAIARQVLLADPTSQTTVDLVVQLQTLSHWTVLPLRPLFRFGWVGSVVLWFLFVGALAVIPRSPYPGLEGPLVVLFLGYMVYSWVWPPILRRLIRR